MITVLLRARARARRLKESVRIELNLGTVWFANRRITIDLKGRLGIFSGVYPWTFAPPALAIIRVLDDQGTLDILEDLVRVVRAMGFGDDKVEELAEDAGAIVAVTEKIRSVCPPEALGGIDRVLALNPHDLDDYVSSLLGPHRVS